MTWELNRKAYDHALELIRQGKVTEDKWEAPRLSDFKDIEEYALFHLAIDPNADPETAGAYAYPYGKNGRVYLRALRSIRAYSSGARGAERNQELFDASGGLLEKIALLTGKGIDELEVQTPTAIKETFTVKSGEQRLITGPVLIPDYRDCQAPVGEKPLSPEEIRDLMMTFYEHRIFDVEHRAFKEGDFNSVGELVESWQTREPCRGYPAGTWIVTAKITDDEVWGRIQDGELTGFSISAIPSNAAEKLLAKDQMGDGALEFQNTPLSRLEDPVICTISLTDKPCVFDAKILSMKEDDMMEKDEKGVLRKIYDVLTEYFTMKEADGGSDDGEPVEATSKDTATMEVPGVDDLISKINTTMEQLNRIDEKLQELERSIQSEEDTGARENPEEEDEQEEQVEEEQVKAEEVEGATVKTDTRPGKKAVPPDTANLKESFDLMKYLGRDSRGLPRDDK